MDTTRADHLGCFGYSQPTSPNLDRLAQEGTRFQSAIATVPLTRPSHSTILTGLLPHHHGVWSNGPYRLDPKFTTMPEALPGFQTGAVVSSFVLGTSFGLSQGFHFYDDRMHEVAGRDPERPADEVARSAIAWIGTLKQQPFFLWLHFYDPHEPYEPPEEYRKGFPLPYDGEIAYMDHAIGDVLTTLRSRGLLNSTLIVATGDHGEGLGDHGEQTHGYYVYDSTMHVPLIFCGPGVPAGHVFSDVVSLTDLLPTILDGLGEKSPDTDGQSVWSQLAAGHFPKPVPALFENRSVHFQFGWARLSGLRTEDWKWIDGPAPELYDLRKDQKESSNIASSETSIAQELRERWRQRIPRDSTQGSQQLSPEEEEQLNSLGYIAASGTGTDPLAGPDPKHFSAVLGDIDLLIRARQKECTSQCDDEIKKILAVDPGNLFALRVEGERMLEHRNYAEALNVLLHLKDAYENHPETLALLAQAYERNGDPQHAIEYYRKATTPPWLYWPALESMARLSLQFPDRLNHDQLLQQLKQLTPGSYREFISVARAYALLLDSSSAESTFRRALDFNQQGAEAMVGIAQIMQRTGRSKDAIEMASRVQPPTVESLFVLGTALVSAGDQSRACSTFLEVLNRKPSNTNLLSGVGYFLEECGKTDMAISAYESSLQADPDNPQALYNLARLEQVAGHYDKAGDLYRHFLRSAPPSLEAQRQNAVAQLKKM